MPIEVDQIACPHCGQLFALTIKKVTDVPAVPAKTHYVAEAVTPAKGGLFGGATVEIVPDDEEET